VHLVFKCVHRQLCAACITCAKVVVFVSVRWLVCLSVCWFVCWQYYSKSCGL